jgi:putrescine transport system substrate-binding protein
MPITNYQLPITPFFLLMMATFAMPVSDPVEAAEQPILNLYNWDEYIGPTTIADFEAETGIHVNYDVYDSTTVVEARLMAGNTGYDLVLQAARYSARLMELGLFMPLDKQRLPGLDALDPWVMGVLARYDPGNRHAVPYMWGTTGFTYNTRMIHERMPDAPVDSAAMLFDPTIASRFADCGISLLEEATMVIPMVLMYLGRPANSISDEDLAAAEAQLATVRDAIRYISSGKMLTDLPNEDVCIAMAWSGDYGQASLRIAEAGADVDLAYTAPREGTVLWFDSLLIPADAPHPGNAHRFLEFLLRPEVIAPISDLIGYANANPAARPLMNPDLANDPVAYPPPEVLAKGVPGVIYGPKEERKRSRAWSRFKTGL